MYFLQVGVGDFVVAEWEKSQWMGHIEKINAFHRKVTVNFLRPHMSRKDIFVIPNIPDNEVIPIRQIIRVLIQPSIKRGLYRFGMNVL